VKAHYNDPFPFGVSHCITFQGCACLNVSYQKIFTVFLYLMLQYNVGKSLEKNYFISFYKMEDRNIFVKMNVVYLCIQKHKYTPKKI
jgi:hypothetical protein